jgi:hypothetical protein
MGSWQESIQQESLRHASRFSGQCSAFTTGEPSLLGRSSDSTALVGFGRLRVALGLLLLTAASLKVYDLLAPGSANTRPELTVAVVLLEGALAAGILLLPPRAAWRLSLLTFAAFAAVASYKWISGSVHCGCFGRVPLHPSFVLLLDLGALAALAALRPVESAVQTVRPRLFAGVAAAWTILAVASFIGVANRVALGEGVIVTASGHVLLQPEKWLGQRLPILQYITAADADVSSGDWTVMLSRPGCSHCQEALTKWRKRSANSGSLVVNVTPSTHGASLPSERTWIVTTPVFLELRDGVVMSVSAEPPSG